MRLLLLQDQVYLPSLGGGNKSTRLLLEGLAGRGHTCIAVSPALTTRAGPTTRSELLAELEARGITSEESPPDHFVYEHRGVRVDASICADEATRRAHAERRIDELDPDWILVTDDKNRTLLRCAAASGRRRAMIIQTTAHLPFGPAATRIDPVQARLMSQAERLIVISRYLQDYLRDHGGLDARCFRLPIYGSGPFPALGRFDRGSVTLINPCVEKGLPIFLELAATTPNVDFAAVPTWGADSEVLRSLSAAPNVEILEPCDDIEAILARTRVLLVPSLWPEAFGYVVVEAMLRGIPVLASDIGGLPEAKLGVPYLLPVAAAVHVDGRSVSPAQDIGPWAAALDELLSSREAYERCAATSHAAAQRFHAGIDLAAFEQLLS
jgi:glycosyltransferase involved in cell wall biosynthesis